MKLLIMCEGPNELAVVNILLDNDCLVFSRDDLINLTAFHARQIEKSTAVQTALNIYTGDFKIIRIGDKMSDSLKIPKNYMDRVVSIEKYCTKPELEILLIIAEEMLTEYEKFKSKISPKDFSKQNIFCGRNRYRNDSKFYIDYFGSDVQKLVESICTYKRTHGAHSKDEHYLAELINEKWSR